MAESAVRVALLARPGTACEHLQAALQQAGAEVVLVADPLGSDAGSVAAATPRAVLVALEPAVEDVLDRYDPILLDPAMTIIYEEAELAAKRDGWDAARWTRHLAAKLAGHDDVLPPGAGIETAPAATTRTPDTANAPALEPALESAPAPAFADIASDGELSLDALEFDIDAPAAVIAPEPEPEPAPLPEPEPQPEPEPTPEPATSAAAAEEERPTFDFSALSLEEIPGDTATAEIEAPPAMPAAGTSAEPGAVVVLAGIGGPDAVRQFLSALPDGFPRPVLVRQRLDGGRHDRLVRQMQRATSLPVQLAEAGAAVAPGHVYILPDGMTTSDGSFAAAADPVPVLAGLPAAGSAVLLLSGSDPAMVADVQAAAQDGALVGGQSPEECFDSAAPAALIAAGAEGAAPADLAARLSARWPS